VEEVGKSSFQRDCWRLRRRESEVLLQALMKYAIDRSDEKVDGAVSVSWTNDIG